MNASRREILTALGAGALALRAGAGDKSRVAITMDDLNWHAIPEALREQVEERILGALERNRIRAALFVIGENGHTTVGHPLVAEWSQRGHMIGNHTWSHRWYDKVPEKEFGQDVLRCDEFLRQFTGFRPYLRFPALKEGGTRERRDWMRAFLKEQGYRNGAVTIDASDWYYDQRLRKCMEERPNFDVNLFREPYLAHLWDRATYYDGLAREVLGRGIPHTMLVHYNLLNSYFLGDVLDMFRGRGWELADAEQSFGDEVFRAQPDTVPAGESLVWALAKATGRYDAKLRYPGEDDVYEKPKLDKLGL